MAKLEGTWVEEPSQALLMGQWLDLSITEPEKVAAFEARYVDEIFCKRPKVDPPKLKAWKDLEGAVKAIRDQPVMMKYLRGEFQAMFVFDDFHGIPYKCMLDVLNPKFITDLKSTESLYKTKYSPEHKEHVNFIDFWGYWTQLGLYQEAVRLKTGNTLPCHLAVVEKTGGFDRQLYTLDDQRYLEAEAQFAIEVFRTMQDHKDAGDTSDDLSRCERCNYCVSTKMIHEPLKIKPRIRF